MKLRPLFLAGVAALSAAFAFAGIQTDIEYGTAAGVSLKLDASVPAGDGPFPACILVHGGGWTKGDKAKQVHSLFAPLNAANFVWFSVNYRMAPEHKYPGSFEDVQTAVRWVKAHAKEYKVDPARIALVGESAGGHLVALVATHGADDTRVAAVVPFYAPTNLAGDAKGKVTAPLTAYFGITEANDEALTILREASPITYVKPGLPPFLLLHGTADQLVDYQQSIKFQEKLRAANVPCDLITVQNGRHGMATWDKLGSDYAQQVVTWLQKTLK